MNTRNDSLFRWLSTRDAGLAELANTHSGEDIEPFLEKLLWENTNSFVDEVLQDLRCGRRSASELVQYLSYPFYSHFREIKNRTPCWIPHFPLFFRNGLNETATC